MFDFLLPPHKQKNQGGKALVILLRHAVKR